MTFDIQCTVLCFIPAHSYRDHVADTKAKVAFLMAAITAD